MKASPAGSIVNLDGVMSARQAAACRRALPDLAGVRAALERRLHDEAVLRQAAPARQPAKVASRAQVGTATEAVTGPADRAPPDPGEDDPEAPTGAGTAAQPLPAETTSAPTTPGRRARGEAHVWVPRGLGNAGLLLALALDGDHWPDAATFTARRLGCSDDSVRRHTRELVDLGLVEQRDGFLVATAAGLDRLRRCDPLPRCLLRPGGAGRTLAVLRGAAVLYGETLGMRANRPGVRGDRERADLAGVHRETIGKARSLLTSLGLATFGEVRRGRAVLVRGAAVTDAAGRPVGSHGRPLGEPFRQRVAATAAKRRATPAETGRVTAAGTGSPIQYSSSTSPIHGAARAPDGRQFASRQDGCPKRAPTGQAAVARPIADPTRRRRQTPVAVGDVLSDLLPDLPAAKARRTERAAGSSKRAASELRRLASCPLTVRRLLGLSPSRAILQMLEAAQVFDMAPKRRMGLAVQVSRVLAPVQVLQLALDVALARPHNVGAVLLDRLKRRLAGDGELLTRSRAAWSIQQFLDAVRGDSVDAPALAETVTARTTPPPAGSTAAPRMTFDEFAAAFLSRRTTA